MKNGIWVKIAVPALLFASGYGYLQAQVKGNDKEIVKLEEKHNEDVKEINVNLKTLIELVQVQAVTNGKIQTTMEFIQKDVEEIKNNR